MKKKHRSDLLRGSLIVLKRRCGKDNCKCKEGKPHVSPALSYSVKGRTYIVTLRESDAPSVEKGLALYKKELAALNARASTGIEKLRKKIKAERKGRKS